MFSRVLVCLLLASSCRCRELTRPIDPADLAVGPNAVDYGDRWVGQRVSASIELANRGGTTFDLPLSIDAPFELDRDHVALARGTNDSVQLTFAPTAPGEFRATLHAGPRAIEVRGRARATPSCTAACREGTFDFEAGECTFTSRPDGEACTSICIVNGQCSQGQCVGAFPDCDDGDVCTIETCDERLGCGHVRRVCPTSSDPCRVPVCNAGSGCGFEEAIDGVVCGPDDCLSNVVRVCITGQCVERPRPQTALCTNRWVPAELPARANAALAFDALRGRLMLFGGQLSNASSSSDLNDTWQYVGDAWSLRTPSSSPPPLNGQMVWDERRGRILLFGGTGFSSPNQTWEWDGTTWLERHPSSQPSQRVLHAMAYDRRRGRVVLFGGGEWNGPFTPTNETWEWDGANWTQRFPAHDPGLRGGHAMTWDPRRNRVVLVGGVRDDGLLWEWDGADWTSSPHGLPEVGSHPVLGFDEARQRLVLMRGRASDFSMDATVYEFDGVKWSAHLPATHPRARWMSSIAWDASRQRIVIVGGDTNARLADTWEWDGTSWALRSIRPLAGSTNTLAWNPVRQRVVLLTNINQSMEIWEWDGVRWEQLSLSGGPLPRYAPGLTFDVARSRLVLFGGSAPSGRLNDTWEWDGSAWSLRLPVNAPSPRLGVRLLFDAARQRVLLAGGWANGQPLSELWEWDGTDWTARGTFTSFGFVTAPMAFDMTRQKVVALASGSTFTWDGVSWTREMPLTDPQLAPEFSVAWDADRQRIVASGGAFPASNQRVRTWEWDGTNWSDRLTIAPSNELRGPMAFDEARHRMVLYERGTMWVLLP